MTMLRPFPEIAAADAADHLAEAERFTTPLGDYLAAKAGEGFWNTSIGQGIAQFRASTGADTVEILRQAGAADPRSAASTPAQPAARNDLLDEQSWKAGEFFRPGLKWDARMSATRARALAEIFDENAARRHLIEHSPTGARSVLGFGAELLTGGFAEPLNFIPFAGPAARAAAVARFGNIGGRAGIQAAEAAAGTTLAQPLVLPSQQQFGDDVGFADAAMNIAFGALFGAAFGTAQGGWRAWRDRGSVHSVQAQQAGAEALSKAAADLAEGRPPQLQLEIEGILQARDQIRGELAAMRADPAQLPGEALETLVQLLPESGALREVLVARGRAVRQGDEIIVPNRGNHGLMKVEVIHPEVTDDDIALLPSVLRNLPPAPVDRPGRDPQWVWRVMDAHGTRQVTYVVKRFTEGDGRDRLVSVYATTDPARFGTVSGQWVDGPASQPRFQAADQPRPGIPAPQEGRAPSTVASIAPFPEVAITPSGRRVGVRYELVELDSLVASQGDDLAANPAFPADLQPRKRDRAASAAQIAEIAGRLDPELLGRSASAGEGAPIIGPDGVVESGNGRVLALRRAFGQGLPGAERYRAWLTAQGFDAASLRQPVLVRRRLDDLSPAERVAFTREANDRATLAMGASERAMADAAGLNAEALALHRGGELASAGNRDFVAAWLEGLPAAERGSLVDRQGRLSQDGQRRLQAALLAKAYEDPALVGHLLEATDDNARAIGGALLDVAPDWIRLRQAAADGTVPADMDQTAALLRALGLVRQARDSGQAVRLLADQLDMFEPQAAETRAFLELMYGPEHRRAQARAKLTEALARYADQAQLNLAGARLFGEPLSALEILGHQKRLDTTPLPEATPDPVPAAKPSADIAAEAAEHGVDLEGGITEAPALAQLEASGRLSPEDANMVRSAEARAKAADDEAAGLEAAAACLLRRSA